MPPVAALRPFLFAAALSALPAAGPAAPVDTNTPAGPARIVENPDGSRDVMIGATRVDLPPEAYLAFFEARLGNLLLVLWSPGGNACAGYYTWVHATPGDIRRSEDFGTCAEATDIGRDAETVQVTMPAGVVGQGDVTFVYDGRGPVVARQAGLAPSGVARPEGWIGRYPFELLEAAELQAPLRALLGADLARVQAAGELASPMQRDGAWVAGSACRKADCAETRMAIAVNLKDGRLLVALNTPMGGARLWGAARGRLPAAIRDVLEGR